MIPYYILDHFSVGPITINIWGFFVALGFIIGLLVVLKEAKRKKVDQNEVLNLAIVLFVSAFVGTRLLHVIVFWRDFTDNFLDIFRVWNGGAIYYGGFLGAILGGAIYVKIKKLDFWKMADVFAFGLPLGYAVGRIGCFLIHEHIGRLMSKPYPWGIEYYDGVRHETTLYSILSGLIIFIILIFWGNKINFNGKIFLIFLILYSISRFVIDIFRAVDLAESDPRFLLGMTISQIISLILLFSSIILLLRKNSKISEV